MQLKITEATYDEKTIIRNLMQLYQHDMSEFNGDNPDSHGMFGYDFLDHYWTDFGRDEGRVPLIIRVDGQVAGFALKGGFSYLDLAETKHNFAELFIMRKWRGKGVGHQVVAEVVSRFPGQWEVCQERKNEPSIRFWRSTIAKMTGGEYREVDCSPPVWDGFVQIFTVN